MWMVTAGVLTVGCLVGLAYWAWRWGREDCTCPVCFGVGCEECGGTGEMER